MRIFIINIARCFAVSGKRLTPLCKIAPLNGKGLSMDATSASDSPVDKRRSRPRAKEPTVAYRLAVASRAIAAIFAGYLLASLASVCLAHWLPLARAEAVVMSMMLSFLVYLGAVLWCFACRSAWRAWAGLSIPGAVLGALWCCERWLS